MADSWEEQAEEQIVYQPEKPKLNPNAGTFNFSAGAASFNPGASFTPPAAAPAPAEPVVAPEPTPEPEQEEEAPPAPEEPAKPDPVEKPAAVAKGMLVKGAWRNALQRVCMLCCEHAVAPFIPPTTQTYHPPPIPAQPSLPRMPRRPRS